MRAQYAISSWRQILIAFCLITHHLGGNTAAVPGSLSIRAEHCEGYARVLNVQDQKGNGYAVCCATDKAGYNWDNGVYCEEKGGIRTVPTRPTSCPDGSEGPVEDHDIWVCSWGPNGPPRGEAGLARGAGGLSVLWLSMGVLAMIGAGI